MMKNETGKLRQIKQEEVNREEKKLIEKNIKE
jgi:hypothetical protein